MNFSQAVTSCLKKYATFNGRAPRSEYWYWVLFTFILGFFAGFADALLFHDQVMASGQHESGPLAAILSLATLLPGLAVTVRRLHDLDRSGWWILIILTGIGIFLLIYWYCCKGTEGTNRFGENPLQAPN